MIGIYSITNTINGKRYIGKSKNINSRWSSHKWALSLEVRTKGTNRHLFNAVKKYGIESFKLEVLKTFECVCEYQLFESELFYIDKFKTTERRFGYNLRRDSSTSCITHDETRKLRSEAYFGQNNPNYGKKWSDEMKKNMSEIAKNRHESGAFYSESWREKISSASKKTWANADKKREMAEKVRLTKLKYNFEQYTKDGQLLKVWSDVREIIENNPSYKWQNIYSVCNGYKKTYMGFVWKKVLKHA